jgi:hypothetical protein
MFTSMKQPWRMFHVVIIVGQCGISRSSGGGGVAGRWIKVILEGELAS